MRACCAKLPRNPFACRAHGISVSNMLKASTTPVWSYTTALKKDKCGLGTYQDSLDLAFTKATLGGGETLVTVQVLPSFQREYALTLKRVGPEIKLQRATFDKQLWTQLGPPLTDNKTRQQCLDLALAAKTIR